MKRAIRKASMAVGLAGLTMAAVGLAATPALAEMSIVDFVLTSAVVDREPTDTVSSIDVMNGEGTATVFARVKNTGEMANVSFVWRYAGNERARKSVNIGTSDGWRTWSRSAVGPGTWQVDLVDDAGTVLAKTTFTVEDKTAMSPSSTQSADMPTSGTSQ